MPKFNLPYQFEISIIMEMEDKPNEEQRLYLRKGHSETFHHLLIKILAYCFFWNEPERLIIEPSFRFRGYKPDLLSLVPPANPRKLEQEVGIWVECKNVTLKKLEKLSKALPRSKICWFNLESSFRGLFKSLKQRKKLFSHRNLKLIGIKLEKDVYEFLAYNLGRKNPIWYVSRNLNTFEISNGSWIKNVEFLKLLE
ncbi:MAG: hypothetical protein R6U96_09065 [Promethearchaeia archaeon]